MSMTPEEKARIDAIEAALLARWPETRIAPTLERIAALTDILGSPQLTYPTIHVGGTNGKTSTSRMIDSMLFEMGLRTGRFTSPHLESYLERIRLTQYYLSLPNELKSEGRLSRSMFRTSMSDYIPQSVLNYDDKTGANAPFRSTQKTIQSRVELTCSLLQQMNANAELVNLIRAKSFKFKYLMATFPELLRWCEKNFDNY